jgi:hypothetical protein
MQRRLTGPAEHRPARTRATTERTPRAPGRVVLVTLALLACAAFASALGAQTQVALGAHAARTFALPGAPYVYGGSFTTYTWLVGLRLSGAIGDVRRIHKSDGEVTPELGAWTADADLVIAPAQVRAIRAALGGLGPYGFVGIGTQGVRREALAPRESGPVWSYGVGLAQPIVGRLYLEGEGRLRRPIVNDGVQPPPGFTSAREFRVGLSVRFGGRGGSRRGGEWERAGEP